VPDTSNGAARPGQDLRRAFYLIPAGDGENETPRKGVSKPGRVQNGITIQRAAGFPPLAPIPPNANSLANQSLTSLNPRRIRFDNG
jgi:hypothetical protein